MSEQEAERLIKQAEQRLSGLVITHRYLTPAECLDRWAPKPTNTDLPNKPWVLGEYWLTKND